MNGGGSRYRDASEADLLDWARAGDQQAFAALLAPHRSMLFGVCLRITANHHDAEDALQAALIAAWRHLDRFEHRSALSTWLYRIAHNAALAVLRRRVPEPVGTPPEPEGAGRRHPGESVADADAVRWALLQLPPLFRGALVLREYGGLSYREIAEVQGIKLATVKTRIARARQAVAALLREDA